MTVCPSCGTEFPGAKKESDISNQEVGSIVYLCKTFDANRPLTVGQKYEVIQKPRMVAGEMMVTVKGPLLEKYPQYAKQFDAKASMFSSEYPKEAAEQAQAQYKRANKRVTIGIVSCVVLIGIIVLLIKGFGNTNTIEGVYYNSSSGLYYSFADDNSFAMGFIGGTEMRIGAIGTYELNGEKLIIYLQYNGNVGTETSICTYNKSADTITNPAGLVFRRKS